MSATITLLEPVAEGGGAAVVNIAQGFFLFARPERDSNC